MLFDIPRLSSRTELQWEQPARPRRPVVGFLFDSQVNLKNGDLEEIRTRGEDPGGKGMHCVRRSRNDALIKRGCGL